MIKWNCDICGVETTLNPEMVQDTDLDGEPLFVEYEDLNPLTGKVEVKRVPAMVPLSPKTVIVNLSVEGVSLQRDFCSDCYNAKVKKKVDSLRKLLLRPPKKKG